MSFIINTSSLGTSGYLTGSGSYTITNNYTINSVRSSKIHYTVSGESYTFRGIKYPVFISKYGKPFIFAYSKNSCEYKKYLK